jgi:hypothetical protein
MNDLAELKQGTGSILECIDGEKTPKDKLLDLDMGSDLSMLDHHFPRCMSNEVTMACAPNSNTLLNKERVQMRKPLRKP